MGRARAVLALTLALAAGGCDRGGSFGAGGGTGRGATSSGAAAAATLSVTVTGAAGRHVFQVDHASTAAAQEQGLMYRTDLTPDGGMLFWPYPPDGGAPKLADFWMKNTPTPLDIMFIRADGTIARLAENTVPFSADHLQSGEPVGAVLEIVGGRAAELGIAEGDRVSWPGRR